MSGEQIKALMNAAPFRPFVIHLPSGKTLEVPHRDYVAISPSGRILVVMGENATEAVVDVMLIERVDVAAAA